jgi:hypothetical protein
VCAVPIGTPDPFQGNRTTMAKKFAEDGVTFPLDQKAVDDFFTRVRTTFPVVKQRAEDPVCWLCLSMVIVAIMTRFHAFDALFPLCAGFRARPARRWTRAATRMPLHQPERLPSTRNRLSSGVASRSTSPDQ